MAARAAAEACVSALLDSRGAVNPPASRYLGRGLSPEDPRRRPSATAEGSSRWRRSKEKEEGEGEEDEEGEGGDLLLFGSAQPLSPPPRQQEAKNTATAASLFFASYSPAPSTPAEVGAQVGSDLARDLLFFSSFPFFSFRLRRRRTAGCRTSSSSSWPWPGARPGSRLARPDGAHEERRSRWRRR